MNSKPKTHETARSAGPENEPASPVCYARDADDVYAGYATRDELLAFLNGVLEAERARKNAQPYSAMLTGWIEHLGGEVPADTGAAATRSPEETARLLDAMLPRIRDDALHADLSAMRRTMQESAVQLCGRQP